MKNNHIAVVTAFCFLVIGCAEPHTAPEPARTPDRAIDLLAGGLDDWIAHPADPDGATWTLEDGVLTCTGYPPGYLRTRTAYRDYRLSVEWRWLVREGNSGVLLHVHHPDRVWPRSIEAQLAAGHAGDFWVIGGAEFNEHTARFSRRTQKRYAAAERPMGEWNRMEIICEGDRIEVRVNGILQNTATGASLEHGFIALQSEGSPIAFRRVHLRPLARD